MNGTFFKKKISVKILWKAYLKHIKDDLENKNTPLVPSQTLKESHDQKENGNLVKIFCKYCSRAIPSKTQNQQCSKCLQYFHKICNLKNLPEGKNKKILINICYSCLEWKKIFLNTFSSSKISNIFWFFFLI